MPQNTRHFLIIEIKIKLEKYLLNQSTKYANSKHKGNVININGYHNNPYRQAVPILIDELTNSKTPPPMIKIKKLAKKFNPKSFEFSTLFSKCKYPINIPMTKLGSRAKKMSN